MSDGQFKEFSPEEMRAVAFRIGDLLLRLPALSRHLRHEHPFDTYRDYVQLDQSTSDKIERAAVEYLHDLLRARTLKTPDIMKKWFSEDPWEYNPTENLGDPPAWLFG